ncbi:MAG: hypothetical protein ABI895_20055 [Deltaproteobacteria bacterium]
MGCWGELERVDRELGLAAREDAALRLRLGQVLEVLGRSGGCFELGFSSLTAYALERCERSTRWVEAARCLARRLEALPRLRAAVAVGRISWSMGELLARVANEQDELEWLQLAQGRTLREVRLLCQREECQREECQRKECQGKACQGKATVAEPAVDAAGPDDSERCTLTCSIGQEESWLFEATRALLEALGTHDASEQIEALLAEGQDTMLAALPRGTLDLDELELVDQALERWQEQLRRWRAEAEELCEKRIRASLVERRDTAAPAGGIANEAALGTALLESNSAEALDAQVRALCSASAGHELRLARLMLALHRMDGWRRLGYATEGHYARERLGLSRSSMLARRVLAARLEALPAVAAALNEAQIGVEAALQLARVVTPRTEAAWLARARQRTTKHLREEVAAALTAVRLSGEADCPPPFDAELEEYQELERSVLSGRVCQNSALERANDGNTGVEAPFSEQRSGEQPKERQAWQVMLQSLERWLEQGVQLSAAGGSAAGKKSSAGRITLRLRVSRGTRAWWRVLEAQSLRWLPRGMSWLKFLCLCLWQSWQHLLGVDVAYGRIYVRDRHRCSSPVCSRTDVTPHHLKYRSGGGGEEDENLASLCVWCHLSGVHGGRIRARDTASRIHWELGSPEHPCLRVDGRERLAILG